MPFAFQTLSNLGNPDVIRKDGPFPCTKENAWLHDGYYFWDEDVELGHWWGRVMCRNNYIICKTEYEWNIDKCWDIYGNYEHRQELIAISEGIKSRKVNKNKEIKVRDIIEELFQKGIMKYEAIRVTGTQSMSPKDKNYMSILLERRTRKTKDGVKIIEHNLELRPPIQICFFHKKSLNRKGFEIIYPEEYVSEDNFVF